MRIFIGTAITAPTASVIKNGAHEHLANKAWKHAAVDQWHVTSLFVGERDSALIPRIQDEVRKIAARTPPILLLKGRILTMPKEAPSMLWIRFMPSPELTRLHLALAEAIGAEPSSYRPYWPHITLARSRSAQPSHVDGDVLVDHLRLDHLTLFRSDPGPNGTKHSSISSWDLTGTDPTAHAQEV